MIILKKSYQTALVILTLFAFVLVGNDVIPGEYADVQMVDVASTVAVLLGTNIPATNEGHPHTEMLTFTPNQLGSISNALTVQQSQLTNAYQTAIGRQVSVSQTTDVVTATQTAIDAARQARLIAERLPRAILGVILVILLSLMFILLAKRDILLLLGGVVIYLLIFNIKYALLDHKTYSLSSVETSTSLIIYCALTTLIALVISWLVFMLSKQAFRFGSRLAAEAALTFILTTIYILSLPVMLHYVINGATVTWALPNFAISFIGLLFLIQALMVAAIGLLLTGVSALISVFAHKK